MADKDNELLTKACRAYRLRPNEVFASSEKDGVVTIVTIGGKKIRWRDGVEVKPLHPLFAGRSIKADELPKPEDEPVQAV